MAPDGVSPAYFTELAFHVATFRFTALALLAFCILEDFRWYPKMEPENLVLEQMLFVSYRDLISFLILFGFLLEILIRNFFAEDFLENGGSGAKF